MCLRGFVPRLPEAWAPRVTSPDRWRPRARARRRGEEDLRPAAGSRRWRPPRHPPAPVAGRSASATTTRTPRTSPAESTAGFVCSKRRKSRVRRMTRVPAISSKAADIPADDFSWRKYGQKLPVENALDSAVDVTRLSCGALYLADFIGKCKQTLEQESNMTASFPISSAALQEMDTKSSEEEYKALQGDGAGDVYFQSLEERIINMKILQGCIYMVMFHWDPQLFQFVFSRITC
ncbi:uncharacterized protein LOC119275997 isoform X2 [Triticum dicoccoides]|uniref:uncharacterized protein LOC119275997 isoform X2 n=1 Tax=Triticum dicoccoides TaxID=85692 RepID=UPI00188FC9B5|nr:uncharacterized protein LOC119275997 isoform X2 [Triticum dicoccoides]XP_037412833.1 uncharacterized protein LOC119275997 isoform X2 [Triticum dicoccoides]XP_037412834.1 uncharacterized protein LOC119275997 isoform X2 [Triticum dicoccoides]XP_037412835.1 uncharacterized protein LOC119275997 isoform X2 [Triticum dicoccoides]XP_037412836.1 uncharacterized protein LOC119275997 isoform X2 [Triticum dicoccoides]